MFSKNNMGVFKVKKNFGWKMSTTFCGSPLIGMSPPSRPSLRTHMMTLVPDYAIKKTKIISDTRSRALRPELLWISVYDNYRGESIPWF